MASSAVLSNMDKRDGVHMFTSIAGRSVVVTGASRGIGHGIARVFAAAGANVLVTGRGQAALDAAVDDLKGAGGEVSAVVADVSDRAQCDRMAEVAVERHGGIDVLCTNAGVFPSARIQDVTPESLETVSPRTSRARSSRFRPALRRWSPPAADASSSRRRSPARSPISGLVTLRRQQGRAARLPVDRGAGARPQKITINAVLPGNIVTEGLDGLGQEYLDQMAASIPQRRLGSTADIGNAALYFASDEAAYVTGQTLVVDGGQVLPESLQALEDI
jgi:3-oxoacyl-[acyl-carrier protein] reductase